MERNTQFVGQSGAFLDAVERVSQAALLNRPVLVIGERGTGKELIAERLHRLSQRWDGPSVTINCAALPETLIEAELYGHETGAFTGATKARAGRFEQADGGTLFMDELATLSMAAQERLLRAVEYGEITRIGSSRAVRVDVRIVAATNEHLPDLVAQNRFRADLLDRLCFEVVTLPPLRAREGDVKELADFFGRRMAAELGWNSWPGFSDAVMEQMENFHWPGNVRELRNVVERGVYRWNDESRPVGHMIFDPFDSPWRPKSSRPAPQNAENKGQAAASPAPATPETAPAPEAQNTMHPLLALDNVDNIKDAVDHYEKRILENALAKHRFNQRQTASALGLSYDQLRHAIKKYDLIG